MGLPDAAGWPKATILGLLVCTTVKKGTEPCARGSQPPPQCTKVHWYTMVPVTALGLRKDHPCGSMTKCRAKCPPGETCCDVPQETIHLTAVTVHALDILLVIGVLTVNFGHKPTWVPDVYVWMCLGHRIGQSVWDIHSVWNMLLGSNRGTRYSASQCG